MAAGLVAFIAVSLSWVTAVSLTPVSDRPWPIGSTNGSVWNVAFVYNGIDRLRSHASPAALALDPRGPLRFLATTGHDYAALVGSALIAAVVFGGLALAVARRGSSSRLAVAGGTFFAVWLVVRIALMSEMQRMQPRYLEAVTPAIAAAVGIGVAWLAARAPRLLGASAVGVAVTGVALVGAPAWAVAAALGAGGLALMIAMLRRPPVALVACALVAALAVPAASAVSVAREHASDAGLVVHIRGIDALSAFLIAKQGHRRYEVASSSVMRAAPLIIRDGRPVLMLTSYDGRPLLSPGPLAQLVRGGDVRYALLGGGQSPVVRWALSHSHRVHVPGVPDGTLYRLSAG